jgi:hypothetical protein
MLRSALAWLVVASTALAAPPAAPVGPANRLAQESSPYLLQHAHNPVDWYPWGPAAFAKAKADNKLIFLSIGYSACHWCHVMERESFANADIAKQMNAQFICVKVDREERPDVDEIYLTALQALGRTGGWPLSMFLTPDGKPIIGGTYFPPDDRETADGTMRGFKGVLTLMHELWRDREKDIRQQADDVARDTQRLLRSQAKAGADVALDRALVRATLGQVLERFDPEHGGFGRPATQFRGTKFPQPSYLVLLQQHPSIEAKPTPTDAVRVTLSKMAHGGIYDQLGGGFHRYSTERTWTVPHFEKMLYDNAQLVEVYARAYQADPQPLYARILRETLAFIAREMTSPDGGFYAALDADSDGHEGRFYVWTHAELATAVPDTAERAKFAAVFGVGAQPNFEEKYNILTRTASAVEPAQLDAWKAKLLAVRSQRNRPFLDTKCLTAWNGQMIAGYAVAAQALNEPSYRAAAEKAAGFLKAKLTTAEGRLLRTFDPKSGTAKLNGYLEDYAFVVHGLLNLYELTRADAHLREAQRLTDVMVEHFGDADAGGYFFTAHDHEKLFARSKDQFDGAQPSGNSIAARNLVRLSQLPNGGKYRPLAEQSFRAFAGNLKEHPGSQTALAAALLLFLDGDPPALGGGKLPDKKEDKKDDIKRSDSVVKLTATAAKPDKDGKVIVTVTLEVDKGWHIYANPVGNDQIAGNETVTTLYRDDKDIKATAEYPKGELDKDSPIGDYYIYRGKQTIKLTLPTDTTASGLELRVKLNACKDGKNGLCLPPATAKLKVE